MTSTSKQVHAGRDVVPVRTGIAGPSGTGKSSLAKKIARMITRAEYNPNVLLVDADTLGRSIQ
jgi:uridine kinase